MPALSVRVKNWPLLVASTVGAIAIVNAVTSFFDATADQKKQVTQ